MAGIAGIAQRGKKKLVNRMLDVIQHRGPSGRTIIETESGTLGMVWPDSQTPSLEELQGKNMVCDRLGESRYAQARLDGKTLTLKRDPLGLAPLYIGDGVDGVLCFSSEVKSLLEASSEIQEHPPGCRLRGKRLEPFFSLSKKTPLQERPEVVAKELRKRLASAVKSRVNGSEPGVWLSGGLDSSALAALSRPHVRTLHTFAAGLPHSTDLKHAADVSRFLKTRHHEVKVSFEEVMKKVPECIYHLESFDALLVRSSITNYLVAGYSSEYVSEVFSGEGSDELFAGYEYLKNIDRASLPDELITITQSLHNTALQRVDRSASSFGTSAHVVFLDPSVVELAFQIPVEMKIRDGVEKWILRMAMEGALPKGVLWRKKTKFWQGTGLHDLLALEAEKQITDADFRRERTLPNGLVLNSKEELMYYRFFRDHFGELSDLSWMGRTRGAPCIESAGIDRG